MAPQNAVRRKVWRYKHADFERANDMICDLDLDEILVRDDIQATWSKLKNAFLNTMESCIPKAVLPMRHNLPWLNKEIVQLIRKRNLLFRARTAVVIGTLRRSSNNSEIELSPN